MRNRISSVLGATALAAACLLTLPACSSEADGTATASQQASWAATTAGAIVVDVRTPAEFSESHVVGAINLDITDPASAAQIAALDPEAKYVVYCRSGNRSATAAAAFSQAGLQVTDAGGLSDVQSAGAQFE